MLAKTTSTGGSVTSIPPMVEDLRPARLTLALARFRVPVSHLVQFAGRLRRDAGHVERVEVLDRAR